MWNPVYVEYKEKWTAVRRRAYRGVLGIFMEEGVGADINGRKVDLSMVLNVTSSAPS